MYLKPLARYWLQCKSNVFELNPRAELTPLHRHEIWILNIFSLFGTLLKGSSKSKFICWKLFLQLISSNYLKLFFLTLLKRKIIIQIYLNSKLILTVTFWYLTKGYAFSGFCPWVVWCNLPSRGNQGACLCGQGSAGSKEQVGLKWLISFKSSYHRVFKNILFTAPLRRKELQSKETKESKLFAFMKKSSDTGAEQVKKTERFLNLKFLICYNSGILRRSPWDSDNWRVWARCFSPTDRVCPYRMRYLTA